MIDGTLIPIDRVAADRPFYSGKHRKHGMNLQVIASPDGDIVWVSGPLPGAVLICCTAPAAFPSAALCLRPLGARVAASRVATSNQMQVHPSRQ